MIKFEKWHGAGNDFILIDETKEEKVGEKEKPLLAKELCKRRYGIGADGLIFAQKSEKAELKMRIFNPDGSEAEMCGNGIRCFALFAKENGLVEKEKFAAETLAGIISPEIISEKVKVKMGKPILEPENIPMECECGICVNGSIDLGEKFGIVKITAVSMGNPHAVIFVDNLEKVELEKMGSAIENHEVFPKKTNVHFAKVISENEMKVLHWERGAGATLACGTGACACAVAGYLNKKTGKKALIKVPGGELFIELEAEGDEITQIYMTGPAEKVFSGKL